MTSGDGAFKGFAPTVTVQEGNPEAVKYGQMWERPEYRVHSPGEQLVPLFLAQARPRKGASVIDFGCGTGRAGLMLAVLGGLNVTMVDFVSNCLDDDVREMLTTQAHTLRFLKADLEKPLPCAAEYGICTDVMEHVREDKVDAVLNNILQSSQHVFFSISTVDDSCGALINEPLHLTVRPFAWWLEQFNKRECVIHWSQETPNAALFYVSAWSTGQDFVATGVVNTGDEEIAANVRHNTAQGWQQVVPHVTNDIDVMLLGGGPSLNQFEDDIKRLRAEGVKLITLNGSYNWALERGMKPSATVMVDARAFNSRFVRPVIDDCKYLISSQCHPDVFEGLPRDRTFMWHTSNDAIQSALIERYGEGGYYLVPGGSTVLLRAIPLMRQLGYRRFHLFGCDSCVSGDVHHAYEQPENDNVIIIPTLVGGRMFSCTPWQVSQAVEFQDLIRVLGSEIELEVHGDDGLLSWILKTAAEMDLPMGDVKAGGAE